MPKLPQHIEERFDDKFGAVSYTPIHAKPAIKSFIATILEEQRDSYINDIDKIEEFTECHESEVFAKILKLKLSRPSEHLNLTGEFNHELSAPVSHKGCDYVKCEKCMGLFILKKDK